MIVYSIQMSHSNALTLLQVNLCWNPPANLGCVDEYRVEIREQDPSTRSLGSFFRK